MSKITLDTTDMTAIGNAIRTKLAVETPYKPGEMPAAILSIPGGITPTGTISIDSNGTYDVTQYASAAVNVSGGAASVPSDYQEVEYIGVDNAYTVIYADVFAGDIVEADVEASSLSGESAFAGIFAASGFYWELYFDADGSGPHAYPPTGVTTSAYHINTLSTPANPAVIGTKYKLRAQFSAAPSERGKVFNVGLYRSDAYLFYGKIYRFKVIRTFSANDERLILDLVPCRIANTTTAGLFDLVSSVFYGKSSGQGTFTAGPDVT